MRPGSVLLIDEAGMVDSATLARLIDHAQAAEAKLVLIGDPAQLGEIEAGGLFAAIASRSEPIVLDEVIRHRHELDREGAKRIREGEGREALERLPLRGAGDRRRRPRGTARGDGRTTGGRASAQGEDALMVAKRNAEVEKLNELARELMRAEGPARRGGDRGRRAALRCRRSGHHPGQRPRAEIYNRERWRVEAVDPESGALVLDGIDTA